MRYHPRVDGVDDGEHVVTPATGERGQWYLWEDSDDVSHLTNREDRMQLSGYLKTDTLVNLGDWR